MNAAGSTKLVLFLGELHTLTFPAELAGLKFLVLDVR
jgi:hypothetical protein